MKSNHISHHRLIAKLGRGTVTDVFLAVRGPRAETVELCAIKRVRNDVLVEQAQRGEIHWPLAEAQRAVQLEHPNIVRTYEAGVEGALPYRVLEYLDAQPCDRVLAAASRLGTLELSWTLYIVRELLAALEYAHAAPAKSDAAAADEHAGSSSIHGQINAHNVLVTYQGEVKLSDFGAETLALKLDDPSLSERHLKYMAPELAIGMPRDPRADVFSVGVLMWECLAGGHAPAANVPESAEGRFLYSALPRLANLRPDLPEVVTALCDRALEPDRAHRFESAARMRDEVETLLDSASARAELASFVQRAFADEQKKRAHQVEELTRGLERASVVRKPTGRFTAPALPPERRSAVPAPTDTGGARKSQNRLTVPPPAPDRISLSARASEPAQQDGDSETTGPGVLAMSLRTDSSRPLPTEQPEQRRFVQPLVAAVAAVTVLVLAGVWLLASSFSKSSEPAPAAALSQPKEAAAEPEVVLRLCGSNTIGEELAPALVEAFLAGKSNAVPTRKRGPEAETSSIVTTLDGKSVAVQVQARGSATAFAGLVRGSCDVGMASRPVDDLEVATLRAGGKGDVRSPGSEHVVALDGIAVIVHPDNPRSALDRASLHDIFTGKLHNWSELGGEDRPIHVLARDDQSGTYDTFKHLVLGSDPLADSAKRYVQSPALADAVASDPAAIGFIGLPYVRSAKALAIGEPGAPATLPTRFTVTTESYMLTRRLYLYTLPTPSSPLANELVRFALSRRGQEVVAKSQFVDLAISIREVPCNAHCPPRYAATVAKAQRASLDFRFRSGSNEPDSRARSDLDRFVSFLGDEHRDAQVLLLGFSDAIGSVQDNAVLSLKRAQAIEQELVRRGVHPVTVTGFGPSMPVASNADEAGRQRNRRVEVWLQNP